MVLRAGHRRVGVGTATDALRGRELRYYSRESASVKRLVHAILGGKGNDAFLNCADLHWVGTVDILMYHGDSSFPGRPFLSALRVPSMPLHLLQFSRWLACLMLVACCGCDAIKSIGQEDEEAEAEVASSEPSLPPEVGLPIGAEEVVNNPPPVEPEAAPQPTPEEILAAFLAKTSAERSDDDLEQLAQSPDLLVGITELDLQGGAVSDNGTRYLAIFPDLERINLGSTRVTSEGVKHLAACTKLTAVTLDGLRLVDDIGVRELSALPLQEISLRSTSVTEDIFLVLSEIEELRILHLDSNANLTGIQFRGLTDKFLKLQVLTASNTQMGFGLQQIGELNDLEILNIGHAEVSDEVLQQLAQCRKLVELDLSNNLITLLGVPFLARLNDLQQLNLSNCNGINDEALNSLGRLENLQRLDISGTQCTLEGAQRLKERLADTVIVFNDQEL